MASTAYSMLGSDQGQKAAFVHISEYSTISHDEHRLPAKQACSTVTFADTISGFSGLIVTTLLSSVLLVSNVNKLSVSGTAFSVVSENRASIQIAVQLIANVLGMVHVACLCQLINYATRIWFARSPISLGMLRFWHGLSSASMRWDLPIKLVVPLVLFVTAAALPAGLWAGAITPVTTSVFYPATILVPRYENLTSLHEWPSEVLQSGPFLRTAKGLFTYSVGPALLGPLLQSGSSATTTDNSTRQHAKIDNTRFFFDGRSFGIGSSVGLVDDDIATDTRALGYSYSDIGYQVSVNCIHNASSDFAITEGGQAALYPVIGMIPDGSVGHPEQSTYVGHGTIAIVAMGVTYSPVNMTSSTRYVAIAAGDDYANLNTVQCTADFAPQMFNVSVGLAGRNITVTPYANAAHVTNVDFTGNMTLTVMRQLELISNDQTSFYRSLVGDTFNASISDLRASLPSDTSLTDDELTLAGVTNSITAILDDVLIAYGSAQLMIAKDTQSVPVQVEHRAFRFGESIYIYSIFFVNLVIFCLVLAETVRTHFWRDLVAFNYTDPIALALGSSASGKGLANRAAAVGGAELWREKKQRMKNAVPKNVLELLVGLKWDEGGHFMIQSREPS